jgi:hypothetical protein
MMILALALAPIAAFAGPIAAAAECPAPPDVRSEMLNLIAKSRAAKTYNDGKRASARMWDVWLRAPNEAAQEMLDAGLRQRDSYDFSGALLQFYRLATYCPAYAEGFNQRAYIHFLQEDYAAVLVDLDIALSLQPLYIAAQAGRPLTLMKLDQIDAARATFDCSGS